MSAGTLLYRSQLHLCLHAAHFSGSIKDCFPSWNYNTGAELQPWSCNTDASSPRQSCPGLPHSCAVPQLCCFTIDSFSLNKVSPHTVPQTGSSCWHWIGDDNLWLTMYISLEVNTIELKHSWMMSCNLVRFWVSTKLGLYLWFVFASPPHTCTYLHTHTYSACASIHTMWAQSE